MITDYDMKIGNPGLKIGDVIEINGHLGFVEEFNSDAAGDHFGYKLHGSTAVNFVNGKYLTKVEPFELGLKQKHWLAALRSGKYLQGKCWLRQNSCFCCLGVFCDISGFDYDYHETQDEDSEDSEDTVVRYSYLGQEADLNEIMMDSIQMWNQNLLINHNDNDGLTFDQIADKVEANPHHYFRRAC